METLVAVNPAVWPAMHVVQIKWTWGRSCFLIECGEHTARVMYPPWVEQREGCLFYFAWLSDCTIKAYLDSARRIVITRNDHVAATVVALWDHLTTVSYRRTYGFQIAEVHAESTLLKLVCDVFCKYFSGRFRMLSGDGLRYCYWQQLGGLGRGKAKLLVSRRVSSDLLPVVIAIATSMLLGDDSD